MNDDKVIFATAREVATHWFDALTHGRIDEAVGLLAPDVEWINYTPVAGYNDAMPWIGTYRGPAAVKASFLIFVGVCDPQLEELVDLRVDGDEAAGVIHERGVVRATGLGYDIEFIQWLTVRDGKITRWKSYTDPSSILRAIHGPSPDPGLGQTDTRATYEALARWLDALRSGDGAALLAGLADDVEFVTPRDAHDEIVPYFGTQVGKPAVARSFTLRAGLVETVALEVRDLGAQGDRGFALVWSRERHRASGATFEIEAAHHFWFDGAGRIRRWRSFFDPDPEVAVFAADVARREGRTVTMHGPLSRGGDEPGGFTWTLFDPAVWVRVDLGGASFDGFDPETDAGETVTIRGENLGGTPGGSPNMRLAARRVVSHRVIAELAYRISESEASGTAYDNWLRAEAQLLDAPAG